MVCMRPEADILEARKLSLLCVSKSITLSLDMGDCVAVFSTNDRVGVMMLMLLSFLGLENPGSSDCCTGCFGNKGKKNLLSVAPALVVVDFVFTLEAIEEVLI